MGADHVPMVPKRELSRSWHPSRMPPTSTIISTLSTNGILINLVLLSSPDSALFDHAKILPDFLEKLPNPSARAGCGVCVRLSLCVYLRLTSVRVPARTLCICLRPPLFVYLRASLCVCLRAVWPP